MEPKKKPTRRNAALIAGHGRTKPSETGLLQTLFAACLLGASAVIYLSSGATLGSRDDAAIHGMQGMEVQGATHEMPGMTMSGDSGSADVARPAGIVRPVSCERLPNVPGKSMTTVIVDYPPNAFTPRHRHPGSVMAYVISGTMRSQLAGGPAVTYKPGQSWFEPPGAVHMFAENASTTESASILAVFVADNDCGPLVIRD